MGTSRINILFCQDLACIAHDVDRAKRRRFCTAHGAIAALLAMFLTLNTSDAMAQSAPAGPNVSTSARADDRCNAGYPAAAAVTSVKRVDYSSITARSSGVVIRDDGPAQLRNGLELTVTALPDVLALTNCGGKPRAFVLFLNGRSMPGITANLPTNPVDGKLIFLLERQKENSNAWASILSRPAIENVRLRVSAGFDDTYPLKSGETIDFLAIPTGWMVTWSALMAVFAAVILWAAAKTGMLRDGPPVAEKRPAMFSLARVQMTFWTFVILGSFAFVGMITGDYMGAMNGNVLGLMGISVGASLGASMIDHGGTLDTSRPVFASTGSWWRDILSDGNDVSIHRFQMAAWTVVLGVIFLHGVYSDLAMPQFSAELLGLLGISAGTYLGLKVVVEAPQNRPSPSNSMMATPSQGQAADGGLARLPEPGGGQAPRSNGKGPDIKPDP